MFTKRNTPAHSRLSSRLGCCAKETQVARERHGRKAAVRAVGRVPFDQDRIERHRHAQVGERAAPVFLQRNGGRRPPRRGGVPLEDRGCSPNGTPLPICPPGPAVAPRKRMLLPRDIGAVTPPFARPAGSGPTKIGSSVIAARRTVGAPQPVLPPFRRTRPCSSRGTGLSIK